MTRFARRSLQALRDDSYQHAVRKLRRLADLIEVKCVTPEDTLIRDRAINDLKHFVQRFARKHELKDQNEKQN